nr:Protein of unknown function DUF1758 domain containing protein [Haemonchus contortus]
MKVNYLSIHSNSVPAEGQTVLEVLPAKYQLKGQPTYLPTGEITALDPTTKSLRKISVLLDTGAEISFIDTALAAELHLPSIKETRLRLHTFGSDHVHETTSREVSLQAWDVEGRPFTLFLHTHEILTKPFETAPICADDVEYILQHKLTVNFKEGGSTVKPSILIGCDQLWTLITCDEPHIQLPSGLHLLPTRLGYIMTGQATRSLQEENPEKEKDKWDGYWTLEGQVNVTTLPDPQSETDENEKWDKLELEEKVPPEQVQEELSPTQRPNNDSEPTGTEHNPSSRILGGHYNLRPRKQRNYGRTVAISPTRQSHLLINILSILIIVIGCSCSSQLSGHGFQQVTYFEEPLLPQLMNANFKRSYGNLQDSVHNNWIETKSTEDHIRNNIGNNANAFKYHQELILLLLALIVLLQLSQGLYRLHYLGFVKLIHGLASLRRKSRKGEPESAAGSVEESTINNILLM